MRVGFFRFLFLKFFVKSLKIEVFEIRLWVRFNSFNSKIVYFDVRKITSKSNGRFQKRSKSVTKDGKWGFCVMVTNI